jgi:hypothetical protein
VVQVSLRLLLLNRPLLEEIERPVLRLEHPLPPAFLLPLSRVESVESGDAGDRQYQIRTVDLRFRALAAGSLVLGPFELTLGDKVLRAASLNVRLGEGLPAVDREDGVDGIRRTWPDAPDLAQPPAAEFFVFPSAVEEIPERATLELRPMGAGRYLLRALVPWRGTGAPFQGSLRMEGLPEPPLRHGPATVTMMLRRATLGSSWVRIDQEIEAGDRSSLGPLRLMRGDEALAQARWTF